MRLAHLVGGGSYLAASDTEQLAANTERSTSATNYTKLKEITIFGNGRVRAKWEQKRIGTNTNYGRIYVNGVAVGVEKAGPEDAYTAKSDDIAVKAGDLVQLYAKVDNAATTAYVRNYKICFTLTDMPAARGIVYTD